MKIEWKSCFKIGLTVFLTFLCINHWSAFLSLVSAIYYAAMPLIIALAAAYIICIPMTWIEGFYFPKNKKNKFIQKTRRPVSLILAIALLLGIIALIVGLVIPELILCVKFIISEIPASFEKIMQNKFISKTLPASILEEVKTINWQEHISKIFNILVSGIGDAADIIIKTVSSIFSGLVTAVISIILTVYLLLDKDRIKTGCMIVMKTYLPRRVTLGVVYCARVFNKTFKRYIVGQCTEAVILGVLCTLTMLIFRIPYAGMVGALIGFTALIPIAGAYIGAGIGAVMILTQSLPKAIFFVVLIIVLQQVEGNLIYPKVVGKSIGLPALWVLVAVTVGGSLMGIVGMLIGVPLTAGVYRIIKDDIKKRRSFSCNSEQEEEAGTEVKSSADRVTEADSSSGSEITTDSEK